MNILLLQQQVYTPNGVKPPTPLPPDAQIYKPTVYVTDIGTVAGTFPGTPKGCILHGSRSGIERMDTKQEFDATRRYAGSGIELGWNATIGDDEISIHYDVRRWGWNARAASRIYLAVEIAQPVVSREISDAQVRAFAWWWRKEVQTAYPEIPINLPSHAEVETRGETGAHDGKTDVFGYGDPRMDDLRARIVARINDPSWSI